MKAKLRSFIQEVKVAKDLWFNLGFYMWMSNRRKAAETCEKIDEHKKAHPIANYIGYMLS